MLTVFNQNAPLTASRFIKMTEIEQLGLQKT